MVQSFANNKHSIVLRYDCYDPNSEIEGNAIGKSTPGAKATGSADLSYKTWGFGWVTDVNSNLRLVGYFDLVKNEKSTSLSGYNADNKDNVFTLRVQYKF
jgi:hypothetical protein